MSKRLLFLVMVFCIAVVGTSHAVVRYVDPNSPGPVRDGITWARAYTTINQAIASSQASTDIWIKHGVYREKIVLNSSMNLYGGFLGGETSLAQRIIGAFPTVIDAEGDGRVVEVARMKRGVIDGITLRNGKADIGGGVLVNTNAIAYIRNSIIEHCEATAPSGGGGVYFDKYAGASSGTDWGYMQDCIIRYNKAPNGGGLVVDVHAYPDFYNCLIVRNHATESGGGLHCPFHSGADLFNCTLAYNTAGVSGGGAYIWYGGPHEFDRCIFAFNSAPEGGGLFGAPSHKSLTLTYTNCDLYGNVGGDWGGTVKAPSFYSGNFSANPLFIAPDVEEYRLLASSPCNNVGAYPLTTVYPIDRIGVAKRLLDGESVKFTGKVVTHVDGDTVYIEERDRSSAIAVEGLDGCVPGNILSSVSGTLYTNIMGVRTLKVPSGGVLQGFHWKITPVAADPSRLTGLLNAMYVRTWGRVIDTTENGFILQYGNEIVPVQYDGYVSSGSFVVMTGVLTSDGYFSADSVVQH